MPYDPARHHRRSIRLKHRDYARPGIYFVTICTQKRARVLGHVCDGRVVLSTSGLIVEQCWHQLPASFPRVTLDAFVIMPDHFHGIIMLNGDPPAQPKRGQGQPPRGTQAGSLPAVVQRFKAASSRRINQADGKPGRKFWQEDYYERVLRDAAALDHIRRYIAANPKRWRG
jgi:REP element-mobilizing transposase RayT